jgi:hypothetical protein
LQNRLDFSSGQDVRRERPNRTVLATESRTLHLDWPIKKTRVQIAVQHLGTAHANIGYIMAAGDLA